MLSRLDFIEASQVEEPFDVAKRVSGLCRVNGAFLDSFSEPDIPFMVCVLTNCRGGCTGGSEGARRDTRVVLEWWVG